MAAADPVSHSLRGLVGNAMRYGDTELADEYRAELRMHNVERALAKIFKDAPPLTAPQVRRLRLLVEGYGAKREPSAVA